MPNPPEPQRMGAPPGLVPEGTRSPYGDQGDQKANLMGEDAAPQAGPPPKPQERRGTEPRDESVAWRPVAQYVGTISVDTEVGLVHPPFSDVRVLRVAYIARGTVSVSSTDYWTITLKLRDEQGTSEDVSTMSLQNYETTANVGFDVFHKDKQLRVQQNHELTVAFTKTGSPASLTQVQVYADLYVGI